jgi:PAS domain S-box-containing protein
MHRDAYPPPPAPGTRGAAIDTLQSISILPALALLAGGVAALAFGVRSGRRQQAALEQAETDARLADIAAALPGGLYLFRLTPDGTRSLPYASEAFTAILGLPPGAPVDVATVFAAIDPADLPAIEAAISTSSRTLANWQGEFRVRRPGGEVRWIAGEAVPRREPDGAVTWQGFLHDVTPRRRMESALAESESRYRVLVEEASDVMIVHDLSGAIVDVNTRACESLGYSRDELLSMSVFDIEIDFDPRLVNAAWAESEHGRCQTLRGRHRRKDGGEFPVEIRLSRLELGGRTLLVGFARDVSERERIEDALRTSEEQYRTLLESMADGVFVAQDRRFVFANGTLPALLGYAHADFVGRPFEAVVAPEFLPIWDARYAQRAEITLDVPPSRVRADPDGLALVLRNLVGNAHKFSRAAAHRHHRRRGRRPRASRGARQRHRLRHEIPGQDLRAVPAPATQRGLPGHRHRARARAQGGGTHGRTRLGGECPGRRCGFLRGAGPWPMITAYNRYCSSRTTRSRIRSSSRATARKRSPSSRAGKPASACRSSCCWTSTCRA